MTKSPRPHKQRNVGHVMAPTKPERPPTPHLPPEMLHKIFSVFVSHAVRPKPSVFPLTFLELEDYRNSYRGECLSSDDMFALISCSLVSRSWQNSAQPLVQRFLKTIVIRRASLCDITGLVSLLEKSKQLQLGHTSNIQKVEIYLNDFLLSEDLDVIKRRGSPINQLIWHTFKDCDYRPQEALALHQLIDVILPLETLVLRYHRGDIEHVDDPLSKQSFLFGLAKHCHSLNTLEVTGNHTSYEEYENSRIILRNSRAPEIPGVQRVHFLDDEDDFLHGPRPSTLDFLDKIAEQIEILELVQVDLGITFRKAVSKFPNIRSFSIKRQLLTGHDSYDDAETDCTFDDNQLAEMLRHCPELRNFSAMSPHHSDTVLLELPRSCPLLEELELAPKAEMDDILPLKCTSGALASVLLCCKHLTSLTIIDNNTIDDAFLRILVTVPTGLETLRLDRCEQITGDFVEVEVGRSLELRNLKELYLIGCEKVVPMFIARLLRGSGRLVTMALAFELNYDSMLSEVLFLHKFTFDKIETLEWSREITA